MADPNLVVKFSGDLSDWNEAIAKAKADLAMLDSYLRKTAQAQNISAKATANDTNATNLLIASLNNLKRGLVENTSASKANTDALVKNAEGANKFKEGSEKAGTSLGGFVKGYLTFSAIMQGGRIFIDATKEVQKFENQLKVASGTQQDYASNTKFLESLADKYNKNVIDLGANFAQLTIATRGTNLEGEKTERLFAAVTATSAALQMSVDDTNGTFRAFIQMVSKGNVQAEELRGQLGERLYGAFNLAAKAMGVSTSELNKMLEKGEVLASDLLPKLTVELENSFGAIAEQNANNLGSAIEYATGQLSLFIAEAGKSSGVTGFFTQMAGDVGVLVKQLRLANQENGLTGVTLGLMDAGAETLFNGTGFEGPTLKRARQLQRSEKWQGENKNIISTSGDGINTFAGQLKSAYGLPSSLYQQSTSSGPSEKETRAAEVADNKARAAQERAVREQVQASNDRIKEAILKVEQGVYAKYFGTDAQQSDRKGNQFDVKALEQLGGLKTTYGTGSLEEITGKKALANPVGDGKVPNYDHITAQINSMTDAWWKEKLAKDASTDANAKMSISLEDLNESLQKIVDQAKVEFFAGLGESIGQLAVDAGSIENVGDRVAMIMGDMISQIGKAIIAYAFTMEGLRDALTASFSNPYVALAVGIAAVAAGSALKTAASKRSKEAQGNFYTGGIIQGSPGLDSITANVSAGEMILNKRQQSNLFGMLDGAYNGRMFGKSGGQSGRGRNDTIHVVVEGRTKGSDIAYSNKKGGRKNRYFE